MSRRNRELIGTILLVFATVVAVSAVRRHLFAAHKRAKEKEDVYFLPAPEQLSILSLGYKAAVADMLWAHVMVSQGLHSFENRRFDNLLLLYDAINQLAPTWRAPYLFADALITFQSATTPYEEVVKAREIMELGVKHLPYDAEIWLNLGQFVAFVAPGSYLVDHPEMAARWRTEGALYLARAAELSGDSSNIGWQALGGANVLARAGELDAAVRFWQRAYAVTDDETLREDIRKKIARFGTQLAQEKSAERFSAYRKRDDAFKQLVTGELPFIRRNAALVLGPPPHPYLCAGLPEDGRPKCATTWYEWAHRYKRADHP
jgi:hypothetical protein